MYWSSKIPSLTQNSITVVPPGALPYWSKWKQVLEIQNSLSMFLMVTIFFVECKKPITHSDCNVMIHMATIYFTKILVSQCKNDINVFFRKSSLMESLTVGNSSKKRWYSYWEILVFPTMSIVSAKIKTITIDLGFLILKIGFILIFSV